MLATIITILILGGGSAGGFLYDYSDIKKMIKTHIVDEERKSEALQVAKAVKKRAKDESKRLKSLKKQLKGGI